MYILLGEWLSCRAHWRSVRFGKITLGRSDFTVKDHGATINARMCLHTWAAFYGTQDSAVIACDIAMLEREVTPVLKMLRKNAVDVVVIHHHMTEEKPMVIFLH
jgi:hypothetical protein